jgi:TPR repeat protein
LRAERTSAGLSLRDLEKATAASPVALARSTVASVEHGKTLPRRDWLVAYLAVCGVPTVRQRVWQQARARIAGGSAGVDSTASPLPPVDACDPRRLGVHASIGLAAQDGAGAEGGRLPELPRYVPRDVDDELRQAVMEAAARGGLVVIVGSSSTGKTRTLYEAVLAELPTWRLFHPVDASELAAGVASHQLPRAGVVVWLDEAQHYLADPNRLTVGTMRALLDPRRPVVVVASMWPQWYEQFTAPPAPQAKRVGPDPNWHARQILTTLAQVIRLAEFSPAERDRAACLAGEDPRLEIALQDSNFGPTQVLAGAPQLVDRWEHASDPYAKALMTAAIDLRRLGHLTPLPSDLLIDALPDYLSARQRATADPEWFGAAIAYATMELHGATSALIPVAGSRMGKVVGYVVADYLQQHGEMIRRGISPPGSLWDAAAAHTNISDDCVRLADQAFWRHLHRHAVLLLTPAAEAGHPEAMRQLSILQRKADNQEEWWKWKRRALEAGDPGTLRSLAEDLRLAGHLEGAEDVLRRMVEDGEPLGMYDLAMLWYRVDREQEAEALLRTLAENGEPDAQWELAMRLKDTGRVQDAEVVLGQLTADGDEFAMQELAELLQQQDRIQEAEGWLRKAVELGNAVAILYLADLLERHGRSPEADDCLSWAAERIDRWELAHWLEERGRGQGVEGYLRHGALAGNREAMLELGMLLEEGDRLQEAEGWLRQAAELGTRDATQRLGKLLARSGRPEQAEKMLRRAAERGSVEAMLELAELLEQRGNRGEAEQLLRQAAETSSPASGVMDKLAELLQRTGRSREAARLRRYGIEPGGRTAEPW